MGRLFLAFALLAGCTSSDPSGGSSEGGGATDTGTATENPDGDCLSDEQEATLGTDPTLVDTDGDGHGDCEEVACLSDPLNADQGCYACGWPHGDPGTLGNASASVGAAVGDVVANLGFIDQCGELVDLWDFAGEYHILFMTASW